MIRWRQKEILLWLKISAQDSGVIHPILVGLLMFGKFSQEFYTQFMITFVQYFCTTEDEKTPKVPSLSTTVVLRVLLPEWWMRRQRTS